MEKKHSRIQRAAILQSAFPGMETLRWAVLRPFTESEASKGEAHFRNNYLLPYLSVDDLKSNPFRFLSLLHCRTNNEVEDCVSFDVQQTKMGWEMGLLATEFCEHAVQMHGPKYGQVVPWDGKKAHRWEIVGFPRAQLVIEAQSILMSFLRKTVERLLENVSA